VSLFFLLSEAPLILFLVFYLSATGGIGCFHRSGASGGGSSFFFFYSATPGRSAKLDLWLLLRVLSYLFFARSFLLLVDPLGLPQPLCCLISFKTLENSVLPSLGCFASVRPFLLSRLNSFLLFFLDLRPIFLPFPFVEPRSRLQFSQITFPLAVDHVFFLPLTRISWLLKVHFSAK